MKGGGLKWVYTTSFLRGLPRCCSKHSCVIQHHLLIPGLCHILVKPKYDFGITLRTGGRGRMEGRTIPGESMGGTILWCEGKRVPLAKLWGEVSDQRGTPGYVTQAMGLCGCESDSHLFF